MPEELAEPRCVDLLRMLGRAIKTSIADVVYDRLDDIDRRLADLSWPGTSCARSAPAGWDRADRGADDMR